MGEAAEPAKSDHSSLASPSPYTGRLCTRLPFAVSIAAWVSLAVSSKTAANAAPDSANPHFLPFPLLTSPGHYTGRQSIYTPFAHLLQSLILQQQWARGS